MEKRYHWIFAFPTVGKSTLAKQHPKLFSDFENAKWRKKKGVEIVSDVYYDHVLEEAEKLDHRKVILGSDPWLMEYVQPPCLVVVPTSGEVARQRSTARGDSNLPDQLKVKGDEWIQDWVDLADKFGGTVIVTDDFLDSVVDLDSYTVEGDTGYIRPN